MIVIYLIGPKTFHAAKMLTLVLICFNCIYLMLLVQYAMTVNWVFCCIVYANDISDLFKTTNIKTNAGDLTIHAVVYNNV